MVTQEPIVNISKTSMKRQRHCDPRPVGFRTDHGIVLLIHFGAAFHVLPKTFRDLEVGQGGDIVPLAEHDHAERKPGSKRVGLSRTRVGGVWPGAPADFGKQDLIQRQSGGSMTEVKA